MILICIICVGNCIKHKCNINDFVCKCVKIHCFILGVVSKKGSMSKFTLEYGLNRAKMLQLHPTLG